MVTPQGCREFHEKCTIGKGWIEIQVKMNAPQRFFKLFSGMIIRQTGRLCVAAYFDAGDSIPDRLA